MPEIYMSKWETAAIRVKYMPDKKGLYSLWTFLNHLLLPINSSKGR